MHLFQRESWIARPVQEIFPFFARAENLETITPPWLHFKILSPLPIEMKPGAHIAYKLRVRGIPIQWLTEIEQWSPPFFFIDVQRKGPYRLWRHTHTFQEMNGGTLMTDRVEYELPFGPLGRLVNYLQVQTDIETIFNYREKKIKELF